MPKCKLSIYLCFLSAFIFSSQAWADNDGKMSLERLLKKVQKQELVVEFSEAEVFLEQNATDGDTEVVMLAKGGDTGIKKLWIFSPTRQLIYKFKSPDNGSNIGGREVLVESPEPLDLNIVLNAYPEGEYTFIGKDFDGEWLLSRVSLVHDIPPPATITFPPEDGVVSRFEFDVVWESVVPADLFIVELGNEDTEEELLVQVPGDQNSFRAPEEWLVPGVEYQISVGVINENGNLTFVEQSTFTME